MGSAIDIFGAYSRACGAFDGAYSRACGVFDGAYSGACGAFDGVYSGARPHTAPTAFASALTRIDYLK